MIFYIMQGCQREVIQKEELHFVANLTVNLLGFRQISGVNILVQKKWISAVQRKIGIPDNGTHYQQLVPQSVYRCQRRSAEEGKDFKESIIGIVVFKHLSNCMAFTIHLVCLKGT